MGEGHESFRNPHATPPRAATQNRHQSSLATRAETVADFLNAARFAAKVVHDFVCPVYDIGEDCGLPYIVMPYCESTLSGWMDANPRPAVSAVLGLIRDVALGLHAVHLQGLVHCDVKPANILWDAARQRVLVAGFESAIPADEITSDLRGTPRYMSPELWQRGQKLTAASDVYNLGVVLFLMLTDQLPFEYPERERGDVLSYGLVACTEEPRKPTALLPHLDPRLDALVLRALAKAPADRYPTAKAFADALTEYMSGNESWAARVRSTIPGRS